MCPKDGMLNLWSTPTLVLSTGYSRSKALRLCSPAKEIDLIWSIQVEIRVLIKAGIDDVLLYQE